MLFLNEQDFNEQEIEEQKYYFVSEHNDLITKARHDLTAQELKIMDFVVSKIKPNDDHFSKIDTSMKEITNVLELKKSGRTYSQVAKNLNDMRKKDVFIYNKKEKSITMTGWFEHAKYTKMEKLS